MSLTIHHLQFSQSERIPWLCEELGVPYELVLHQRAPFFAPQSIKDLSPMSQAPIIKDSANNITLFESAACVEYIIHKFGCGRLALPPSHKDYADYLYWFHYANGTFQPALMSVMISAMLDPEGKNPRSTRSNSRWAEMLAFVDARVSKAAWLAGDEFTAADIMIVTTLTTMRGFQPYDLSPYKGILAYLKRIVDREGYQRARAKADPGLEVMIDGKPPLSFVERLKAAGKL